MAAGRASTRGSELGSGVLATGTASLRAAGSAGRGLSVAGRSLSAAGRSFSAAGMSFSAGGSERLATGFSAALSGATVCGATCGAGLCATCGWISGPVGFSDARDASDAELSTGLRGDAGRSRTAALGSTFSGLAALAACFGVISTFSGLGASFWAAFGSGVSEVALAALDAWADDTGVPFRNDKRPFTLKHGQFLFQMSSSVEVTRCLEIVLVAHGGPAGCARTVRREVLAPKRPLKPLAWPYIPRPKPRLGVVLRVRVPCCRRQVTQRPHVAEAPGGGLRAHAGRGAARVP